MLLWCKTIVNTICRSNAASGTDSHIFSLFPTSSTYRVGIPASFHRVYSIPADGQSDQSVNIFGIRRSPATSSSEYILADDNPQCRVSRSCCPMWHPLQLIFFISLVGKVWMQFVMPFMHFGCSPVITTSALYNVVGVSFTHCAPEGCRRASWHPPKGPHRSLLSHQLFGILQLSWK